MSSEIRTFREALEEIEKDKRLDKLEDYQKYQLALEVMKTSEFNMNLKQCVDDIVDILNYPVNGIIEAIESLNTITINFDEDVFQNLEPTIQLDNKLFGRKVRGTKYNLYNTMSQTHHNKITVEGTLIGANGSYALIENEHGQVISCGILNLEFIDDPA